MRRARRRPSQLRLQGFQQTFRIAIDLDRTGLAKQLFGEAAAQQSDCLHPRLLPRFGVVEVPSPTTMTLFGGQSKPVERGDEDPGCGFERSASSEVVSTVFMPSIPAAFIVDFEIGRLRG